MFTSTGLMQLAQMARHATATTTHLWIRIRIGRTHQRTARTTTTMSQHTVDQAASAIETASTASRGGTSTGIGMGAGRVTVSEMGTEISTGMTSTLVAAPTTSTGVMGRGMTGTGTGMVGRTRMRRDTAMCLGTKATGGRRSSLTRRLIMAAMGRERQGRGEVEGGREASRKESGLPEGTAARGILTVPKGRQVTLQGSL